MAVMRGARWIMVLRGKYSRGTGCDLSQYSRFYSHGRERIRPPRIRTMKHQAVIALKGKSQPIQVERGRFTIHGHAPNQASGREVMSQVRLPRPLCSRQEWPRKPRQRNTLVEPIAASRIRVEFVCEWRIAAIRRDSGVGSCGHFTLLQNYIAIDVVGGTGQMVWQLGLNSICF